MATNKKTETITATVFVEKKTTKKPDKKTTFDFTNLSIEDVAQLAGYLRPVVREIVNEESDELYLDKFCRFENHYHDILCRLSVVSAFGMITLLDLDDSRDYDFFLRFTKWLDETSATLCLSDNLTRQLVHQIYDINPEVFEHIVRHLPKCLLK